jgi:hypothetical protein
VGRGDGCDHEVVVADHEGVGTAREVRMRDLEVTWRVCGLRLANDEIVVGRHELVIRDGES